jgi:hypothetical protein
VNRFYTPDVISVGEAESVYVGREQIRPLYQDVVKSNRVKIESVHTFVKVYPTDGKTAPFTFAILFPWTRIEGGMDLQRRFLREGQLRERRLATPAGG